MMTEIEKKNYFKDFIKKQIEAEKNDRADNYETARNELEATEYNQLIYFEAIFFRIYTREINKNFKKNNSFKLTDEEMNTIFEESYEKSNLDERSDENYDGEA